MLNNLIIQGRLTHDLELKTTPNGVSVLSFRIAVQRNYKEKGSDKYPTDFFNAVAWRTNAEFISRNFKKGNLLVLKGSLENRDFVDKNNVNRTVTEIIVSEAHFCEKKEENGQGNGQGNNGGYIPEYTPAPGNSPFDDEFTGAPDDFIPDFTTY